MHKTFSAVRKDDKLKSKPFIKEVKKVEKLPEENQESKEEA